MPNYKDKKTNEIYFYDNEKAKDKHLAFLKTPVGQKLGLDLDLETIYDKDMLKIINPPLTTEQRIKEIRQQYDKAIQDVCTAHLFNDINSARNLSTLTTSPLQFLAKKITDWELEQQAIFIALLNDAENDIINIDSTTFDDNFVDFNAI